jgi:flagellar motor component MotA
MTKDEFNAAYIDFLKIALGLAAKARREGILGLDSDVDRQKAAQRDIFHYGLQFTVDGTAPELTGQILTNIIEQEKDELTAKLKTIQKRTVLAIAEGLGSEIVRYILNSYTDLTIEEEDKLLDKETPQ